ncbi:hypothetical protein M0R72_14380 [Candidatus Pacearchaeota archaeon]|nr:hypothetical protein [Candidatus Pacearchaeota archaeon]
MKLHEFNSYDEYKAKQIHGSRRRPNRRPSANSIEFGRIVSYLKGRGIPTKRGICHGARCGTEIKLFKEMIPELEEIIGTDLSPRVPTVIEWDFQDTKPEWKGVFDFVYSNSFDHSSKPLECLQTWMSQLKPTGLLFLCWTFYSTLDDRPVLPYPGGDCFGAALHEYIQLCKNVGTVLELFWVQIGHGQVVIVVEPKRK